MSPSQMKAIKIIAEFEELLNEKGISIPCEDREGEPDEARIYGSDYYDLENKITEILDA